jgi:Tol biopolymer transport system component
MATITSVRASTATGCAFRLPAAPIIALLFASLAPAANATPGDTELVSVSSLTREAAGSSFDHAISADGRFVAFQSYAPNLVPDDTNGASDIFVHDRQAGTIERVNVDSNGMQARQTSWRPSISADGRFVVFETNSSNLVPGNSQSRWIVALRDRVMGSTELISTSGTGTPLRHGLHPAISANGRFVVFESVASDLVARDTNGSRDIFIRDRQTGSTELVSIASDGIQANCYSTSASISADGRYVGFSSCASNLVAGDTNGGFDVFVHDRQTGLTERASVDSSGKQGFGWSQYASISADGRYVVFASDSALVPDDTNDKLDVFVRDRQTGITERISVDSNETQADGDSFGSSISADGRFVAFFSNSTNMTPEGFRAGIFVRDRQAGVTSRASVDSFGGPTQAVGGGMISADGRFVAFNTDTPLAANDLNRAYKAHDVYVHELGATRTPSFDYTVRPTVELTFGDRTLYTRNELSFWLGNRGPSALPIVSMTLRGVDNASFSHSSNCHFVMPGDWCRIRVGLKAAAPGPKSALLKVIAGIDTSRTRHITAVVVKAAYALSRQWLAFGTVPQGATVTKRFTLSNTGTSVLPISSISLAGHNPWQFAVAHDCPGNVEVGATCTLSVSFRPASTGLKKAHVIVTPGGGAAAGRVYVSGTGT